MNIFKTMILMLMLVSVSGLGAEELLLEQFAIEFNTAFQSQDIAKVKQLMRDNPNITNVFRRYSFELERLSKEGRDAYNIADYPTALKKWEQGLELAYQAKSQLAISEFLNNIGSNSRL